MKTIRILALFILLFVGTISLVPSTVTMAQSPAEQADKGIKSIGGGEAAPLTVTVKDLVNIFLYIIGAVAVVMIVYAGFKYVTSAGDTSAVSAAKNTILYAAVGLVVAIGSYAIVNFVITGLDNSSQPLTAEQCQQIPVDQRYHEEECS